MKIKEFTKKLKHAIAGRTQFHAYFKEKYQIPVPPEDDALVIVGPEGDDETFILHIIKVEQVEKK